jgi:hypothetical protein
MTHQDTLTKMLLTKLETADTCLRKITPSNIFIFYQMGRANCGPSAIVARQKQSKKKILKAFFVAVMRDYGFESKQK